MPKNIYNSKGRKKSSLRSSKKMQGGAEATALTNDDLPLVLTGMDTAGGRILDIVEEVIKAAVGGADEGLKGIVEGIVGDLPDKPWDEVAPLLKAELERNRQFAQNFLDDDEMKEAVKQLVETYVEAAIEAHRLSEPAINEMVEEFWETADQVATRSTVGLTNTAFNVGEAAVGEIPVIGGAIDLAFAAARGFNHLSKAIAPLMEKGPKMLETGTETYAKARDTYEKYGPRLKEEADRVKALSEKATARANQLKSATSNIKEAADSAKSKTKEAAEQRAAEVIKKTAKYEYIPKQSVIDPRDWSPTDSRDVHSGGSNIKKAKSNRRTKRKRAKKTLNRLKRSIDRFTRKK